MNNLNKYTIKAILDSKKCDFDLSKFSRKDLEYILFITISEYRHIKTMYEVMLNLDKTNIKE